MSHYLQHLEHVKGRFDHALQGSDFDAVLIAAGQPAVAFLDDNAYPYRVNPLFKYWLPITASPKSFIYYRSGEKPRLFLYQARDFWHSTPKLPPGEWQEGFDVTLIDNVETVVQALGKQVSNTAFLGEVHAPIDSWGLAALNPESMIHSIHFHRAIKTEWELQNMRKANVLAARGHNAARDAFYAGKSELEIHAAYLAAMKCRETETPYNSIIALNQNGAILHYDVYDADAPAEHRSFLIDAGAYYNGYCADITRSYAAKDGFYGDLVAAVDAAELAIIKKVKPGVSYYDLHVEMHRMIAQILADFGFFKVNAETIFERGYTRPFFPHGLGHYIGLQVHDVGGYLKSDDGTSYERDATHPFLRLRRELEAGQVFTIEPGIYVIDQLLEEFDGNEDFNWQRIAELRPYGGVRIEDSVVVTADGYENITRNAFASLS